MNKALLRKQLLEFLAMFRRRGRKSKRAQGRGSVILYAALMIYVALVFVWLFAQVSGALCRPLVAVGLGWFYFAILGLMAMAFGIYGCIFNVQSSVYQAKDNDLLLSMPIPPGRIIFMRLANCYAMAFIMTSLVMCPAEAWYLITAGGSVLTVLFFVLTLFLLPLLVLAISCVLGWLLALASRHVRDKNVFNVAISLAFLAVYFLLYFRANTYLTMILSNTENMSGKMRIVVYPLYKMGQGLTGEIVPFLLFALICLAVMAVVYKVMSGTFLALATAPGNVRRKEYKGGPMKTSGVHAALFRRELRHFRSSSNYMLNSSMGTIFMVVAAILVIARKGWIQEQLGGFFESYPGGTALLVCALLIFTSGTNELTAPSISLEGRSIWLVQSMPVKSFAVLWSKIELHMVMTLIPAAFVTAAVFSVVRLPLPVTVMISVIVILNVLFDAVFGVIVNLRFPNLEWKDETAALKQSSAALLSLFGNWGLLFVLAMIYVIISITGLNLTPAAYMGVAAFVMAALIAVMLLWLSRRGAEKFATL